MKTLIDSLGMRCRAEINPSYEWLGDARDIGISHRELEVLALAIEGYHNKEIADILHIQHQSVKNHMHHLMNKLGVKNGSQAAVIALSMNLIKWKVVAGDINVELNADKFLKEFKRLIDGRSSSKDRKPKDYKPLNVKLLSHGIDVDKLASREGKKKE